MAHYTVSAFRCDEDTGIVSGSPAKRPGIDMHPVQRRDGRIKVLDFGLAKLVKPEENHEITVTLASDGTLPGMVIGTVGYMSPEQVRGEPIDPRSNIFSFGA